MSPAKQSKKKCGSKTLPVLGAAEAAIMGAAAMAAEAAITAAVASAFSSVVAEAAVEATGAGSVVGWFGATDVTCHIMWLALIIF